MFKKQRNLLGDKLVPKKALEEPVKTMSGLFEQIDNGLGVMPEALEALKNAETDDEVIEQAHDILEATRAWARMLLPFNRSLDKFMQGFETKQ